MIQALVEKRSYLIIVGKMIEIGEKYMASLSVGKPILFTLIISICLDFLISCTTRLFLLVVLFFILDNLYCSEIIQNKTPLSNFSKMQEHKRQHGMIRLNEKGWKKREDNDSD